jgi:hypothetical protein
MIALESWKSTVKTSSQRTRGSTSNSKKRSERFYVWLMRLQICRRGKHLGRRKLMLCADKTMRRCVGLMHRQWVPARHVAEVAQVRPVVDYVRLHQLAALVRASLLLTKASSLLSNANWELPIAQLSSKQSADSKSHKPASQQPNNSSKRLLAWCRNSIHLTNVQA